MRVLTAGAFPGERRLISAWTLLPCGMFRHAAEGTFSGSTTSNWSRLAIAAPVGTAVTCVIFMRLFSCPFVYMLAWDSCSISAAISTLTFPGLLGHNTRLKRTSPVINESRFAVFGNTPPAVQCIIQWIPGAWTIAGTTLFMILWALYDRPI